MPLESCHLSISQSKLRIKRIFDFLFDRPMGLLLAEAISDNSKMSCGPNKPCGKTLNLVPAASTWSYMNIKQNKVFGSCAQLRYLQVAR